MTSTQTGNFKYALSVDSGAYQTWDGASWVAWDNTYANASTLSQVNANIPSLVGTLSTLDIKIITQTGATQGDIDQLDVQYTGQLYPTDNPTVTISSGFNMDELLSFAATFNAAGSDAVKFILKLSGVDYWWNGASWVASNGTYAESTLAADIETNKAALTSVVSAGKTLRLVAVLHSDDGSTTPDITDATMKYSFAFDCNAPIVCVVYGCILDNSGQPVSGAVVTVDGEDYFYDESLVTRDTSVTTGIDGKYEIDVIETTTDSQTVNIKIEYTQKSGQAKTITYEGITIPNQATAKLSDLVA